MIITLLVGALGVVAGTAAIGLGVWAVIAGVSAIASVFRK